MDTQVGDSVTVVIRTLIDELLSAGTQESLGELSFRIFDPSINRTLHLRSSRRIPITRHLVDILTQEDITFSIND